MKDSMKLIPVILSGGSGTRLWPVSRQQHPKPFIRLPDGESLIQKVFKRAVSLPNVSDVLTITNQAHYFKTEDDYREVNAINIPTSYILEPFGRNTAPAIAAAALQIAEKHGDNAIMLVLAADHLIEDQGMFDSAVTTATELAQQGYIVTFGISPDAPETGYGYIEAGNAISDIRSDDGINAFTVKQFVEKPCLEKAEEYIKSGGYSWNSGMFCTTAGTILTELDNFSPEITNTVKECFKVSKKLIGQNNVQIELDADTFQQAPDISIDYAVMEKSKKAAVVTCDIGWSDIGSWNALGDLEPKDENGNRSFGEVIFQATTNCYVRAEDRLIGTVGVKDLIIVDTKDALLVMDKSQSQDVKKIVQQLKDLNHHAHIIHREVTRPWGTYTTIEEGEHFKIKRIVVKPGASLSLQMHHHRSEHWVVVSGMAHVINGDEDLMLNINESTFIPAGHKHRLENTGVVDLILIEVQSGQYLGEDDIVRFDDKYGRVSSSQAIN